MKLPMVILAGGLATRLRPLTKNIPKAIAIVAGKPFIFWQLELLKKCNFKNVIILTGYLGEKIEKLVGNGKNFNLDIRYYNDGDVLLGTGGAVKKISKNLPDHFFLMYGDTYLPINFKRVEDFFFLNKLNNVMTIAQNKDYEKFYNVYFKNNKILSYDKKNKTKKANYIDYGLSIFSKDTFFKTKKNAFNLDLIFQKLINRNDIKGYIVHKSFYEINTIKSLELTEHYLKRS